MKWLWTFLAGALCGALALFFLLSSVPRDNAGPSAAASIGPPPASAAPVAAAPVAPPILPPVVLPVISPVISPVVAPVAPPATAAGAPAAKLMIPVRGVTANQLSDTFGQARGAERRHEALDIMAPMGTPVLAAADGKVAKLFDSKPGGLTLYQFDPSEKFSYYYAHLDRYANGVSEGMRLKRGDLIGYVGATGNAGPAEPHLHFAVFELGPEKRWWQGTPVNPYPLLRD